MESDGLPSAVRLGLPQALVPDLDFAFALVAAACGEAMAVRAEGHAPGRAEAPVEGLEWPPGRCIPDDDLPPARRGQAPAVGAGGHEPAVGAEGHDMDPAGVSTEGSDLLPVRVPELDGPVHAGRGEELPVR